MSTLPELFPSLTLFSDLNWEAVTQEYQNEYGELSFPEYLQQKAVDGDCPAYLFELAFYELARREVKLAEHPTELEPGIYLNPTALFLNLEFDVEKMLAHAQEGKIDVIEREHILCLYQNAQGEIKAMELSQKLLEFLQELEDALGNPEVVRSDNRQEYAELLGAGLVLHV